MEMPSGINEGFQVLRLSSWDPQRLPLKCFVCMLFCPCGHHWRQRAANLDQCSALIVIAHVVIVMEGSGAFHTYRDNDERYFRGPLTPGAFDSGSVKTCLNKFGLFAIGIPSPDPLHARQML